MQNLKSLSIGISFLPDREYTKHARRGFQFNIAVVGESGIGKSTLIENLFSIKYKESTNRQNLSAIEKMFSKVYVDPLIIDIEEKGIKVRIF